MNFSTNKERGNSGLGIAIGYFSANGYTVSIPLNDTQDYDLIVEKENVLKTVQVKSTGFKTKYGIYQISTKSCGGTKGKVYKTLVNTKVDYLFALTENISMYLIPINEIDNSSSLNLGKEYLKFKVAF